MVQLGKDVVSTDGHTRAFAAYLHGLSEIQVVWDEDDLDWEAYRICVEWCRREGIRSIADLRDRVVSPQQYQLLWLDRCHEMHQQLAARRELERTMDTGGQDDDPDPPP